MAHIGRGSHLLRHPSRHAVASMACHRGFMRSLSVRNVMMTGLALLPSPVLAETVRELPLDRGFYVHTDETCRTASMAVLAVLTREGLSWTNSACTFGKIERPARRPTASCRPATALARRQRPGRSRTARRFPSRTRLAGSTQRASARSAACPSRGAAMTSLA